MAPMQTTIIRASMTAYSTAVGPSSDFRKFNRNGRSLCMCRVLSKETVGIVPDPSAAGVSGWCCKGRVTTSNQTLDQKKGQCKKLIGQKRKKGVRDLRLRSQKKVPDASTADEGMSRPRRYGSGRGPRSRPSQPKNEMTSNTIHTQNKIFTPTHAAAAAKPNPQNPKIMARMANKITSPSIRHLRSIDGLGLLPDD